ncbi:hypothetical protein [Methanosarcina sp. 2.H.A.1B.4]|jgi:hypothetical protein|nr:hypothetical protein [Methanosarcina sp. 2.H.A.1B.4]
MEERKRESDEEKEKGMKKERINSGRQKKKKRMEVQRQIISGVYRIMEI